MTGITIFKIFTCYLIPKFIIHASPNLLRLKSQSKAGVAAASATRCSYNYTIAMELDVVDS